jgi:tRNA uridine 5-carbamoylmethylation protein Kti12
MTVLSNDETLVILWCGLPAVGKSTLARSLSEFLLQRDTHDNGNVDLHVIEYDALQHQLLQQNTLTELEAWRQARILAFEQLTTLLRQAQHEPAITTTIKRKKTWILLDDTFHLASMRKQVYHCIQNEYLYQTSTVTQGEGTVCHYPIHLAWIWLDAPDSYKAVAYTTASSS